MRRECAHYAEVIGSSAKACDEVVLPQSINEDSCGEWIPQIHQPASQRRASLMGSRACQRMFAVERLIDHARKTRFDARTG